MKVGIGILLAALAAYVWGFLYWGLPGPAYSAWQTLENDAAVMTVLKENFPRNGTYFLPGRNHDENEAARLFEQGPVAIVHILARDGRPMMDASIMALGLLHYIVAAALLAILLERRGRERAFGRQADRRGRALGCRHDRFRASRSGGRSRGLGRSARRPMISWLS